MAVKLDKHKPDPESEESKAYIVAEILRKSSGWAIVGIGTLVANLISHSADYLHDLSDSVNKLNNNVSGIVEQIKRHDVEIQKHSDEIIVIKTRLLEDEFFIRNKIPRGDKLDK